ncbi:transglutaminase domain-containing protein [[Clostridium] fimetarium]|uniref:Transglutaminase-like superfamily protein n=1 Tax=[Clostridium] fimetarium TaxID=99656 RepID=A0A1I0R2D6_9FIRM|nr:transglutaminase domain-containing protein [[Clostridium] fimetarium]SEW34429.1 Transglutaminase-like superfamily protein [[Clostridium] fimetarium]
MKIKGLNLFLSAILVLSLAACTTPNSNKGLSSAQSNDSTISALALNSDQNTTEDNASTQLDAKSTQANKNAANATEVNNNIQNSNDLQDSSDLQAANESDNNKQVTQAQNNTTTNNDLIQRKAVIDNVVIDTTQEVATQAPIVGNGNSSSVTQTSSENNFSFIQASGSFRSWDAYVQYLKSNGATYVSSTAEAITVINNICKNAQSGMNLCFSGDVDIASLVNVLPKDTTVSGYIDVNVSECEYIYNDYYFAAKFTWWTSSSEEAAVNSLVAQMLPSLNQGTTYDKIKNVHDYICNIANYSTATLTGAADDFSAYDALYKKLAVCQGYALSFQKFMDAMGIEAQIVKGDIDTKLAKGSHAWNIVKLNGAWYCVDCTWDGQDDSTRYDYFLLGAKEYPYGITGGINFAPSRYIK